MVQEQRSKISFQDSSCGGHFGFPINTILAIFLYLLVGLLLIRFNPTDRMVCEEMSITDFQDGRCGGHLGFPIGTILAIFNLMLSCS